MLNQEEALASLRVLVAVAKADGVLHADERAAIQTALQDAKLPEGTTIDSLLGEVIDVGVVLGSLKSDEAKHRAYESAYALAHADGQCTAEEKVVLEKIRVVLGLGEKDQQLLDRLFSEARDTVLLSNIMPIADEAARTKEIKEDILKYSILTAVLGTFPVPGVALAADLTAIALQLKMMRDIGQYYGHKVGPETTRSLLAGLGASTATRIAVNNLAKFIPFWGSALGAATNFASTWALGIVADQYFASGMKIEMSVLKESYERAKVEGKAAFSAHKKDIDAKKESADKKLQALHAELTAGKITQAEYEKRVAELAA